MDFGMTMDKDRSFFAKMTFPWNKLNYFCMGNLMDLSTEWWTAALIGAP
jgi:hypothetical protein